VSFALGSAARIVSKALEMPPIEIWGTVVRFNLTFGLILTSFWTISGD
jgi:hypothetical protein